MNYITAGYSDTLDRLEFNKTQSIDPLQFDNFTDEVSGSKVQNGIIKISKEGSNLNLDNGLLNFTNGVSKISIGNLPDASFGLQFLNNNGEKILSLTDTEEILNLDKDFKIKNIDTDSVILDNNGIVGSGNFVLATYTQTIGIGTGSNTYLDVPIDTGTAGSGYPLKINLPRPTSVLVLFTGQFGVDYDAVTPTTGEAAIFVDNVFYTPTNLFKLPADVSPDRKTLTTHKMINLSTGEHTITMRMKTTNAGFNVYNFTISVISLGK